MKKILLFTDSRGVHKPVGSRHSTYPELLIREEGLDVTSLLCPFQWTTIPDFLEVIERYGATSFDYIILHVGIVDHSPRPLSWMINKLYSPESVTDSATVEELFEKLKFAGKKIINRKKDFLDKLFTEEAMQDHFSRPFDTIYKEEKTINLYSVEMMLKVLVPRLKQFDNLVFISSNNFVPGWEGDFPGKRPANIRIIEDYSRILCQELPNVINLHQWWPDQVREFTTDNLHLSADGNNWVFDRVMEAVGRRRRDYLVNRRSVGVPLRRVAWPLRVEGDPKLLESIRLDEPVPISPVETEQLRQELGRVGQPLACLIIGLRIQKDEPSRLENLRFLMSWLNRFYGDAFDLLLVEQDVESSEENLRNELVGDFRYKFLYNPEAYNHGWLYNVAVKHFTDCPVVAFCDTDILPGSNFFQCIIDCYRDFDAVSPNRNLYYSTAEQKKHVLSTGSYADMPVTADSLKNPTSLAGGMLVFNRASFLDIGGFEQYVGYGCEDRALDVTMLELLPPERVRMDSFAYFHLYHPMHDTEHVYFKDIYAHMVEHYGCEFAPDLSTTTYIHGSCCHEMPDKVRQLAKLRAPVIGDPDLYRNNSYLTINGLPPLFEGVLIPVGRPEPVLPPEITNLNDYIQKEELRGAYAASWAPPIPKGIKVDDTAELAFFYNRYKGRRCFIIGNGPSLNMHDLSLLKDEYTFAVNSIYYKTRETGFRPTFFVVEDSSVMKENREEIVAYEAPFKFFPEIYRSLHPKVDGTYFFKINRGFYEKSSPNYAIPRFSTDITKGAFCGQSVTYINLQLAYFMGFTEVFLIGMDFNYEIPASHKRTGDILLSDTDDPNHFHKDYFGKGKTWKDPKLDRVLMNYKMARLVYECAGRKIYNATIGGKLEAFERVNFEDLLRKPDPRVTQQPLDLIRPRNMHEGKLIPVGRPEPVLPPEITNLNDYIQKEELRGAYAASWAPPIPKGIKVDDTAELAFFYNRYKGRRCFIIGNGPSLNMHDLSLLKDEYTFAVNSIYYKTRETGFRPTFFVVEDSSVMKENREEIVAYEAPFKFFPEIYRSLHPKVDGTYFFKINRGFYEKSSPNYAIPRFSTDITKGAFCGQSVTYINLQLAYFMGFTEVFLIGMDFNYEIPASHKRTGDILLSDTDDPNHFHKDYFGKGKTWKDPKLDRVLMNYKMARLVYECAGRKIYNATIGGKLEAFERVNYNGLFGGLDPQFEQPPLDLTRRSKSTWLRKLLQQSTAPLRKYVQAYSFGLRLVYSRFTHWLKNNSPRLFRVARVLKRNAQRTLLGIGTFIVLVTAPIFLPALASYGVYFWIAASLLAIIVTWRLKRLL